jgi:hypothetical protein
MTKLHFPYPWFKREDYAAHRAIDTRELPDSYDTWLRDSRLLEQLVRSRGLEPFPIELEAQSLADWCAARGRTVDAAARAALATEVFAKLRARTMREPNWEFAVSGWMGDREG